MQHIIIPTDFSIRSLQPVHAAMNRYPGQKVRILLLHLVEMPSSIGELLFSRCYAVRHDVPQPFRMACEAIANRYGSQLAGIPIIIRNGETVAFLENMIDGFHADAVFMLAGQHFCPPFEDSVDIYELLRKSSCNIIATTTTRNTDNYPVSATVGDLLQAYN